MLSKISTRKKTIYYWDAQARWQQIWLEHNDYHREILAFLAGQVQPGWRVLDIGAGNGVLALPLQSLGCQVTALEPSRGMRHLLWSEIYRRQIAPSEIDERCWEDVPVGEISNFEIILACNSLQLITLSFQAAFAKMFIPKPRHVCVVTELGFAEFDLLVEFEGYRLSHQQYFHADSSYAYRHLPEAWEHLAHRLGRTPTAREKKQLMDELVQMDNRLWLRGSSKVGIYWWTKQ